ncbi:MAG: aminotransferase class I/II-fold pyridoxal phosphate-dependent enzyme [Lachnospiraceae bacterium]|nr:aminotransferase class I/II-fold pyridoxal phosphate-dependent enzyme [Lachnospiraceae bacterium]
MMRLCAALKNYVSSGFYPGYMPGHKGNDKYSFFGDILKYDITEIDDMDNLHDAKGIILESQKYAAALYGADETYFLVNGSTVGILSSILACTESEDKILIGRNCHRSVYNAVVLNKLDCYYVYPGYIEEFGINSIINPGDVENILKSNIGIKVVVITSPTYEGISSDIASIAKISHKYGAILIVDAAHGAHFGFNDAFPDSAVKSGADIIIHSVHKTLPSLTQTALLHVAGTRVNKEKIRELLKVYQTSSPSYLFMASIDNCMSILKEHGKELFDGFLNNISEFESRAKKMRYLIYMSRLLCSEKYKITGNDICKIVINTKNAGISGKELNEELRSLYKIQPEMAADNYCLFIMTIMDTKEGFERLITALEDIDEKLFVKCKGRIFEREDLNLYLYNSRPIKRISSFEALKETGNRINLKDAMGRICADYISIYPPGIPVLVPGEEISVQIIEALNRAIEEKLNVQGVTDNREIRVYG